MKNTTLERDKQYGILFILGLFLLGIIVGSVFANFLGQEQIKSLKDQVNQVLVYVRMGSIDHSGLFQISLIQNGKAIFILWIFGFFVFGTVVIEAYVLLKGFEYGFTTAFITKQFGLKGMLFSIFGVVPQNILFIPVFLYMAWIGVRYCGGRSKPEVISRGKHLVQSRFSIKGYFVYFLGANLILILIGGVETFITPTLLQWFVK